MASKNLEFDAVVNAAQFNKLLAELASGSEAAARAINAALGGTVTKRIELQEVSDGKGGKTLLAVERQRLSVTDQLINKQNQLNKTQAGSVTSLRQQLNNARQLQDATARYERGVGAIGNSIRRQNPQWISLNDKVSRISRELSVASASGFWDRIKVATRSQGLINISNGLVGITQGFQAASILAGQFLGAINSVVDAAAKLQSFALAFKAIGAGSAGSTAALQESSRIALGLGVELNTVIEGFKQLSPVVLNSGGTLNDVSNIVESLSSRFAAFGISGDRARRVMNGVIQAFSKGKLQAEELTQQISEADPAFKTDLAAALFKSKDALGALGKEIDGTIPNLEKLVKAQKLTSEVLIKVLPQLSKSELLYGKLGNSAGSAVDALERSAVTIDQVRSNLGNLNELSLRELALSSQPLINALLRVQAVITDTFTRISQSDGIDALSSVGAKAVVAFGGIADALFVIAEGAFNVVGALKPLIDLVLTIASIPGVAQVAGLAILGNLIAPLKLMEKRVAQGQAVWSALGDKITGVFTAPKSEINEITGKISDLNKSLGIGDGTSAERKKLVDDLKKINDEQDKINAGPPSSAGADRLLELSDAADRVNTQLTDLDNNQSRLAKTTADLTKQQGGLVRTLEKGARDGATYAQRNASLAAQNDVLVQSSRNVEKQLNDEKKTLRDLSAARETFRLDNALNPESTPQIVTAAMAEYDERIEKARDSIAGLTSEQSRLVDQSRELQSTINQNQGSLNSLGNTGGRVSRTIGGALTGGLNLAKGAINGLKSGISGLIGLIDPLTAIIIAAGIGARLYADGTKDATEAAKRYADQNEILKAAINDINPAQNEAATQSSALGRAWERLAFSAVKLGDALAGIGNGIASKFEGFTKSVTGFTDSASDQFVNIAGSIALVSGSVAAFGAAGAALGAGFGPIGLGIGLVVGVISALAIGASQATIDLEKLRKELEAIEEGAKSTTLSAEGLLKALKDIKPNKETGSFSAGDLKKAESGVLAIANAYEKAKTEKIGLEAESAKLSKRIETYEAEKKAIGEINEGLQATIDKNAERLKNQKPADFAAGGSKAIEKESQELGTYIINNTKLFNQRTEAIEKDRVALTEIADTTGLVGEELKKYNDILAEAKSRLRAVQQENVKTAQTLETLAAAVKFLQDENAQLELGGPPEAQAKARAELDGRIVQIRELQGAVESLGKTKVELRIEIRKQRNDIANSQDIINNPTAEGAPARDANKLAREVSTTTDEATNKFEESVKVWRDAIAKGANPIGIAGDRIKSAGLEFYGKMLASKAALIQAGESIKQALGDAKTALADLRLSRPEFFSPAETQQAKDQVNSDFAAATQKAGFTPAFTGTEKEVLQFKQEFVKARKQNDDLVANIASLNDALATNTEAIGKVSAAIDKAFGSGPGKKANLTPGKITGEGSGEPGSGDGLGDPDEGKIKRIGEVYGKITANGKTMVLYQDRMTGQAETITQEAFNKLKAEQAVTKELTKQNGASKAAPSAPNPADPASSPGDFTYKGQGSVKDIVAAQKRLEAAQKQLAVEKVITKEIVAQNNAKAAPAPVRSDRDLTGAKGGVVLPPPGGLSQGLDQFRAIAERNGGEYNRVLAEVLANGSPMFMGEGMLNGLVTDTSNYKNALTAVSMAQQQVTTAQIDYNAALATGKGDVVTTGAALENAKATLVETQYALEGAASGYKAAGDSAKELGIDINSVPSIGDSLDTSSLAPATAATEGIAKSLLDGSTAAQDIASSLSSLPQTIYVNIVRQPQGFFTGGPVSGGQEIRVNELGKEGFLSRSGTLSPINVPANATWRPPSDGTVIPADMWKQINAPSGRIKVPESRVGSLASRVGGRDGDLSQIARRIEMSVLRSNASDSTGELAVVQAQQAIEIGKLSRAVDNLAKKKWNVQVAVPGSGSGNFLSAINHRL